MDSSVGAPPGAPPGPPGGSPPSQFVYNETEAHFVIAFGAFMSLLATVSVAARLYSRYFTAKHIGLDDWMAVGALAATIVVNVLQSIYAAVYLPQDGGRAPGEVMEAKLFYVNKIMYTIGVTFYKLTFLVQFWRIFRYIYYMRILYLTAIVLIAGWSISQILLTMMTCLPLSANWEMVNFDHESSQSVVCLPVWVPTYLNAGGTVLTDMIVLLLPVPALWSLKLKWSQKWAAFGVFGIGGIVPLISAGRIWALGYPPPNGFVRQSCFNTAELSAGVITAGLATIRLIISRHFPSRSLASLPSRNGTTTGRQTPGDKLSSKRSGAFNSQLNISQISSRNSDTELFIIGNNSTANPGRWGQKGMGNSATVTTGRYDRSMSDGGAEFLKEFGIIVETNWEVTETVIDVK